MLDYAHIKAAQLRSGQLWEDPDFPAIQPSVFYYQVPPFSFEWKRAKELYPNPKFMSESNDTLDVVTGRFGDKWFLTCVEVLFQCKGLFSKVVPPNQSIDSSYAGIFKFRFYWCGRWIEVLIDDRLPTVNGKLAFMHCSDSEQLWPALLEKAYAKIHGSYEALKYGNLLDGLADFTGGISESMTLSNSIDATILYNLMKVSTIVTGYQVPKASSPFTNKIESGMNYRIYNVEPVKTIDGNITYFVRLGRPLAPGETATSPFDIDQATELLFSGVSSSFFSIDCNTESPQKYIIMTFNK